MTDTTDIQLQLNLDPMRDAIYEHLRGGVCEVSFIKKDGSRRILIGTLQPELITASLPTKLPVNPPEGTTVVQEEVKPAQLTDVIRVFDIEANAWRSFTLGGFIAINPRYTGVIVE